MGWARPRRFPVLRGAPGEKTSSAPPGVAPARDASPKSPLTWQFRGSPPLSEIPQQKTESQGQRLHMAGLEKDDVHCQHHQVERHQPPFKSSTEEVMGL